MKNSVKLFALTLIGLTIFSCTTDDYDAELNKTVKVTENIESTQSKEGDEDLFKRDSLIKEETQPVIVIKKD